MITMTPYALVDSDGFVRQQSRLEESDGPNAPYEIIGLQCHKLAGPLDWSVATQTKRYKWVGGAPVLVETGNLPDLIAAAIAQTYIDVDRIHDAAVGKRGTEYARAEEAAIAYKAAGYTGTVSGYLSGHAENNRTGMVQSAEWAAKQIIERADMFRWAELAMRNMRFAKQNAMRTAATPEDLVVAVASWKQFIAALHAQLGV